jgi:hypothetical protein
MIKIYYHVAKINNWLQITKYFFNSILNCGLYQDSQEIKICLVGNNLNDLNVLNLENFFKKYNKIKIFKFYDVLNYEFPTIQMLHDDAFLEDFSCLYFHSKGASFNLDRWNAEKEILKIQYAKRDYKNFEDVNRAYKYTRYWTRNLLIKNYKKCLDFLDSNDIVCLKKAHNENFIPINFWWSKSKYIRTLNRPRMIKDRYDAELWICKNKGKIKSFLNRIDEYKKNKFL